MIFLTTLGTLRTRLFNTLIGKSPYYFLYYSSYSFSIQLGVNRLVT